MKKSNIKTFEDLPYFINVQELADILGIAISSCYELMHEKDFPTVRIGKRMVVPKDKFLSWVDEHTKRGK
jgi:excisionase family DNA binding protein